MSPEQLKAAEKVLQALKELEQARPGGLGARLWRAMCEVHSELYLAMHPDEPTYPTENDR